MVKSKLNTIILIIVFLSVQALAVNGLIRNNQYGYAKETTVVTLVFIAFIIFEARHDLSIGIYVKWLLAVTLMGHHYAGEYLGLYISSNVFDKILHVFGAYTFTLLIYLLLNHLSNTPPNSKLREVIFIISLGIALGTIFEIIEFFADTFFHPKILNQPSLEDTDIDLISDVIGSVMAAIHLAVKNFSLKGNDNGIK